MLGQKPKRIKMIDDRIMQSTVRSHVYILPLVLPSARVFSSRSVENLTNQISQSLIWDKIMRPLVKY